ncbi:MAG: fimbrillin family protein, partial [Muribaculaceae bacterium]|nr:fimbrillin family protein [Muribaculaceae bacterium]
MAIDKYTNILHLKTTSPATVKAWYPAEPQTDVSIANQSGLSDFSSIDYLTATAENQSYKNPVDLPFKHQMAKVRCVLNTQDYDAISTKEMSAATVIFNGYTVASFAEGELTGSATGDITPIKSALTHEALLVPTNMTGEVLFRVNLNVKGYAKSFSYIPEGGHIDLKPGTTYVFNVTLSRDKMVVSEISASWDGEEEKISSEPLPINLYFSDDIQELFDEGIAQFIDIDEYSWDDEDGCYKIRDNTFTISLLLDEYGENLMKGFIVKEGIASINRVRFEDRHVFTFKVNTESVRLEYGDYIQVGDFLYANGKWRPDIVGVDYNTGGNEGSDKEDVGADDLNKNPNYGYGYDDYESWECIGVIFKVGPGNGDTAENYDGRLETIHGYAVALHDASIPSEMGNWGGGDLD